ncbi:hypothetical protein CDAR_116711 [Caerostris darwini]|uniref:Uncharacterized protein n=1 Tax=Caerostris darwini TaxID=1538125 RepID=A0AAV4R4S5_9ARAC|nr:hypothetical protein CDAR_116711 [Caerostris darwini]
MHLSKLCHARGREDAQGSLALLTPSGMQGRSLSVRTQGQYKTEKLIGVKDSVFGPKRDSYWSLSKEEGKSLSWKPFGKRGRVPKILQDAEMHLRKSYHATEEKEDGQGSLALLTLRNAGTFALGQDTRTMEGRKTNRCEGQYFRTQERFAFSVR